MCSSAHNSSTSAAAASATAGSPRAANQSATRDTSRARNAGPLRVADHVDDLWQVDHHEPARHTIRAVHEQVERRQVAVREAVAGKPAQRVGELAPQVRQLARVRTQLGQARSGRPVG
jgi:hypothetical protein